MTTPPADPPVDPDAGLSDEEKAAKKNAKSLIKEAFAEFIEENKPPEEAPKRTKQKGGDFMSLLFGGSGSKDE